MVYPANVIEAAPETRNLHQLYGDPFDIFYEDRKASAPFPEKIPAFFIDLLTRRGDTVLDPFAGSGTTGKVAQDKGRNPILIEKEPSNIRLILNRLNERRNAYFTRAGLFSAPRYKGVTCGFEGRWQCFAKKAPPSGPRPSD